MKKATQVSASRWTQDPRTTSSGDSREVNKYVQGPPLPRASERSPAALRPLQKR